MVSSLKTWHIVLIAIGVFVMAVGATSGVSYVFWRNKRRVHLDQIPLDIQLGPPPFTFSDLQEQESHILPENEPEIKV